MLDPKALQQLVEQQVQHEVATQVSTALDEERINKIEDNAIKFIQDRIVAKFSNSEAMPELIDAVKSSVKELFSSGQIPGLGQYVDYDYIKQTVDASAQSLVQTAISELSIDTKWLEKVEAQVNHIMIQRVVAGLGAVDIRSIVNQRVDETLSSLKKSMLPGIQDQSTAVELTILDQNVVIENTLTAKAITAVDSMTTKDLVVKGNINTDNASWQTLADTISQKTLNKLSDSWKQTLVKQVVDEISNNGIEFASVKINGHQIVTDNQLSRAITESNLQSVGLLSDLRVKGQAEIGDTLHVSNKRIGINTADPEMALSVWDEEVVVIAGKYKSNTAYLGTSRKQALTIGINKKPAIEINEAGLTAINQLQLGIHRIDYGNEVPNYSGSKGDIVFNANPSISNPVFAWVCLGGFKWKQIKAVD